MLIYALRRLALGVVVVSLAMAALFAMIYVVPGDPASVALGPRATPEMIEALRARGARPADLDAVRALLRRGVAGRPGHRGPVGPPRPGGGDGAAPLHPRAHRGGITWSVALGIPPGCLAAVHRGSVVDRVVGILSVAVIAVPSFVVAIYALLIFAVTLRRLPASGAGALSDRLAHLILHSLAVGQMISSAVFAEIVFARPGIGKLVSDAILTRNYPLVTGALLVTTVFFVLVDIVADLVVGALDPRVRRRF